MTEDQIKTRAHELRKQLGGTIFVFPIEEDNPYSGYAVVVYRQGINFVYPQATDISLAAAGVKTIMDLFKDEGISVTYEKDVRFISYQAQMDGPNVMMRRLKKEGGCVRSVYSQDDLLDGTEDTGPLLSARGTLKLTYLSMVEDDVPKAAQMMDKYYELLAMKRYGKPAREIRKDVRRMSKDEAITWIERTYGQFIKDPMEVFNLFGETKK